MDKEKRNKIIVVVICVVIILSAIIFAFVKNRPADVVDDPTIDLYGTEDPGLSPFTMIPDDEYYGVYDTELTDTDKAYIQVAREQYSLQTKGIWNNLKDYKFSDSIAFTTYDGDKVSPLSSGKPFLVYFAKTRTGEDGKLTIDKVSEDMAILKAGRAEEDPEIYILPQDPDVPIADFQRILANADYYTSMNRDTSALYELINIDGIFNPLIYFNSDGTPAFATISSNLVSVVDYCQKVFDNDISFSDVVTQLETIKSVEQENS